MFSSSQLWVVFGPLDSNRIILFVVNSGKGKARGYIAGVRKDELCLSLSQLQPHCCDCCSSPIRTFSHTWVFESPPPAEMICYDKSQPNQAFCQEQLENVHVFIACTFYISYCHYSLTNVLITHISFLPQIKIVLQLEKPVGGLENTYLI